MVSTLNLVAGGLAILLGVAWIVRPMVMVYWQSRILYFWTEEPEVDHVSPTVARIGGLILVAAGVVLVAGIQL